MPVVPRVRDQRSHVLVILSSPIGDAAAFLAWYRGAYLAALEDEEAVLAVRQHERSAVDVGRGKYPVLPFAYLDIVDLGIDGAEEAEGLIERIHAHFAESGLAGAPATWLYHPISERVGTPASGAAYVVVAFANEVPGSEAEFREWYSTRHIRHALHLPVLVSGQCFERSGFQRPGSLDAGYRLIAIYEQDGTPEALLDAFAGIQPGLLDFPSMDKSRFAESAFRRLPSSSDRRDALRRNPE